MLIALAVGLVIIALGVTACRAATCPKHSDGFDVLLCPLCSIKLFRHSEIEGYEAGFAKGRNGSLIGGDE